MIECQNMQRPLMVNISSDLLIPLSGPIDFVMKKIKFNPLTILGRQKVAPILQKVTSKLNRRPEG